MTQENNTGSLLTLISLTRQLTRIILEENSLLETRRPREAAHLNDEKERLKTAYEQELMAIHKIGGLTAIPDAPMLRQLKAETRLFNEVLDTHKRILVRLRTVTESMVKAIGDEVNRINNPVQSYGINAAIALRPNRPPTSLALNRLI
jgi:hypothetical protein